MGEARAGIRAASDTLQFMFVVDLSADGVWLSAPVASDTGAITTACADPDIAEWTTLPEPYTRADAERFVRRTVPVGWADRNPTWAIRLRAGGTVSGMIGLMSHDESAAEIGYWLAAGARSRGVMTAAVKVVCDFGFRSDGMGLERIEWRAFVGNHSSARVARNVGFQYEGLQRLGLVQRGRRRDAWAAALLAGDPRKPAAGWPSSVG